MGYDPIGQGHFEIGKTFYNGQTIDSNNIPTGITIEGQERTDPDKSWNTSGQAFRSGHPVTRRIIRNNATFNLIGKKLATYAAGFEGQRADGMHRLTPAATVFKGHPIDEYLPSAGVPQNDFFYVVVRGPCLVLTSLEGDATNSIAVGNFLVTLTAGTSGSTTSGRVQPLLMAATENWINIASILGRALSAKTTTQTNNDLLINVGDLL